MARRNSMMDGAMFKREAQTGEDPNVIRPVMEGTVDIAGVQIRVAMWPKRAAKKAGGKDYFPLSGEYARGEIRRLVDVTPTVCAAAPSAGAEESAAPSEDLPF